MHLRLITIGLLLTEPAFAEPMLPAGTSVVPPSGAKFESLDLARLPTYVAHRKNPDEFAVLSRQQIVDELRQTTGLKLNERGTRQMPAPLPRINCRFDTYSIVDHQWFEDFLFWFTLHTKYLGLTFRPQYWDCDDYSMALNAMADLALMAAKECPPPQLVGRLIIEQRLPWANVKAGGLHEIVIFRSDRAWWVAEPQNGQKVALADYPNRTFIQEILFN